MTDKYYYCGVCKRLLGTREFSRCPYCGTVFNASEDLGAIVRTKIKTKIDTKLLKYTVVITLGVGTCMFSTTIILSQLSQEWALFFSNLGSTLTWQLKVTAIFFAAFVSVFWGLFWNKIDQLLIRFNSWSAYLTLQRIRRFFIPLARHKRTITILLLIVASGIVLPLTAWKFKRSLDSYDVIINLAINILGGLIVFVLGDLVNQKEQVNRDNEWKAPPTLGAWESMRNKK